MSDIVRWCCTCRQHLPVSAFGKGKQEDGLHQRCKRCNVAQWQRWYEKNRAKFCAYVKGLRDGDPDYRRRVSEQRRRLRKAEPDRIHAQDRAKHKKRPPQYAAAQRARRRALIRGAPGAGITATEWREIRAATLGVCPYCGESGRSLSLEHIVPLSSGGAHDPENVIAVCGQCNRSKGDRPLVVWMARRAA